MCRIELQESERRRVEIALNEPKYPESFSSEEREELTAYYREDILQLQELLGRDLSHWLEPQ